MNRPRVALVFPVRTSAASFFGFVMPSLGLERLGAAIEDVAEVALFDARFEPDVVAAVAAFRPDVIALNVKTTLHCRTSYGVADRLRAALPAARLVLGGLHATSAPREALDHGDVVLRGEGELAFRRLVLGEPAAAIPGAAWHGPDGPVLNPMGVPAKDLDGLAPPARHLRKPHYRYEAAGGGFRVDLLETSRGCTHACSFCSPASVYPHAYRTHSPAYVMAEIERLAARGTTFVMLTDDHLGGDHARVEALCDLILASGVKMAFFAFIRAFPGRMALKRKMAAAGFVMLSYGAENPSKEQLRRYGKGYPPDAGAFLRQVNREWREAGACYVGNSFVFGDVRDDAATLAGLGAYARWLDPTYVEPIYAQPYPNTRYRAELAAEGRLLGRDWPDYTEGRLLVAHPELGEEELRRLRARMWVDFLSPRKAADGGLLVPLHLHRALGVPARAVVRYMRATAYAMGGCILEEKFYADLHEAMVHDWCRRALPAFEPEERELPAHVDDFAAMIGLRPLLRLLGRTDVVLEVHDGGAPIAAAAFELAGGRIGRAHVVPGPAPARDGVRRLRVPLAFGPLAAAIGARGARRAGAVLALVANLALADVPRRLAARLAPLPATTREVIDAHG